MTPAPAPNQAVAGQPASSAGQGTTTPAGNQQAAPVTPTPAPAS
ncbi:hypothetical protein [Mycolicibacterium sp. CBMA 360]|nr:hypothetical protein [Mycolicibacterium sp. CBMA 360]